LEELVEYGRQRLEQDEDIRRLYSQAAGLTHFLMHGQQLPFINYLRIVYRGLGQVGTLSEQTGLDYAELDRRYHRSLDVSDRDLAFVDRKCRNLCLGHTSVTDVGLEQLNGLQQLRWLDLSFTATTDAGFANFAAARHMDQLNLEKTRITDRSMEVVAKFHQLEELDLSQTDISDAALRKLTGLTRLKILWLTGTQVTDAGLQTLAPLGALEQLDVQGTRTTPAGLTELKQHLPNLQ
jgi:hypothetical protein